jgi:hypothetical protein
MIESNEAAKHEMRTYTALADLSQGQLKRINIHENDLKWKERAEVRNDDYNAKNSGESG